MRNGVLLFVLVLVLASCASTSGGLSSGEKKMRASWYGKPEHGGPTASGERFNMNSMTAAHKTLPLGTVLVVKNPANNKQVKVTINDRGPYIRGRDLDLSYAAAKELEITKAGVANLHVKQVGYDSRYKEYIKKRKS